MKTQQSSLARVSVDIVRNATVEGVSRGSRKTVSIYQLRNAEGNRLTWPISHSTIANNATLLNLMVYWHFGVYW